MKINIILLFLVLILFSCKDESVDKKVYSKVGESKLLNPNNLETDISDDVISITDGIFSFYAGYEQVSSDNKNPVLMKFKKGELVWSVNNYETSGDDGTCYGILWDGNDNLFAVFSATGTQGDAENDYRRFCKTGWLSSYGNGGGPKVAVILKINIETGNADYGTFLIARKSDGKTNSLVVTGLSFDNDKNILVTANSWYSPLKADKTSYACVGESPFIYEITFDDCLQKAINTHTDICE